jgi:hypothetical protein
MLSIIEEPYEKVFSAASAVLGLFSSQGLPAALF